MDHGGAGWRRDALASTTLVLIVLVPIALASCGGAGEETASGSTLEARRTTTSSPPPPRHDWQTLLSGTEQGISWSVQRRVDEGGDVCARVVTDPSPIPADRVTGTCEHQARVDREGLLLGGAATLSRTRTVVAGGLVPEDVSSLTFVTTTDDEFVAEREGAGWVVVAPTSIEFERVVVDRPSGAAECTIVPSSDLVAGHPICGP